MSVNLVSIVLDVGVGEGMVVGVSVEEDATGIEDVVVPLFIVTSLPVSGIGVCTLGVAIVPDTLCEFIDSLTIFPI